MARRLVGALLALLSALVPCDGFYDGKPSVHDRGASRHGKALELLSRGKIKCLNGASDSHDGKISRDINARLAQLGLDPVEVRNEVASQVHGSDTVYVDANELKRRYYEEFFKARNLRGVQNQYASAQQVTQAPHPLPEVSKTLSLESDTVSSETLQLSHSEWYVAAEVKHARTSMMVMLLYTLHYGITCGDDCGPFSWMQSLPAPLLHEWGAGHLTGMELGALGIIGTVVALQETTSLIPDIPLSEHTDKVLQRVNDWMKSQFASNFLDRLQTSELLHGRFAMLGWAPILYQYLATTALA